MLVAIGNKKADVGSSNSFHEAGSIVGVSSRNTCSGRKSALFTCRAVSAEAAPLTSCASYFRKAGEHAYALFALLTLFVPEVVMNAALFVLA